MKELILSLLCVPTVLLTAEGQSLPNGSFENWLLAANGADSAVGWSSSNSVVIYPVRSLEKNTDAKVGMYAAHVITAPFGFVQYSTVGMLVNGNATFNYGGGGNTTNVSLGSGGGTPINYKPTALRGYFKYVIQQPDNGMAHILLTKYNVAKSKRDTVSFAQYHFSEQNTYASFNISLPDMMPGVTPDTISCIFYSSDPATVPTYNAWSDLYLDSLNLFPAISTRVDPVNKAAVMQAVPNPSNGCFTIKALTTGINKILVYDVTGRLRKTIECTPSDKTININMDTAETGTYFLVADKEGSLPEKIVIQK